MVRLSQVFALGLTLGVPGLVRAGSQATITRTNLSERWITNVIEITMPVNRFVNEYHTNRVEQALTNFVDVYVTNKVTRNLTNTVEVTAYWTNVVVSFQTNWNMRTVTNPIVVVAYRTNWVTRTQTNSMAINLLRTNIVDRFQTNLSTLTLTNWETVVLFKTNWITETLTNVAEVNLPRRPAPAVVHTEAVAQQPEPVSSTPATGWAGPVVIDAVVTGQSAANDLVEVQMRVRRTDKSTATPQVQQWRVERADAAIFLVGQGQEFKRQLPVGKYKVEARLKALANDPPVVLRGTLSVTAREAVVQPRLLVKK